MSRHLQWRLTAAIGAKEFKQIALSCCTVLFFIKAKVCSVAVLLNLKRFLSTCIVHLILVSIVAFFGVKHILKEVQTFGYDCIKDCHEVRRGFAIFSERCAAIFCKSLPTFAKIKQVVNANCNDFGSMAVLYALWALVKKWSSSPIQSASVLVFIQLSANRAYHMLLPFPNIIDFFRLSSNVLLFESNK